jgi:adenylyltransferase/sulfurtransferase
MNKAASAALAINRYVLT